LSFEKQYLKQNGVIRLTSNIFPLPKLIALVKQTKY